MESLCFCSSILSYGLLFAVEWSALICVDGHECFGCLTEELGWSGRISVCEFRSGRILLSWVVLWIVGKKEWICSDCCKRSLVIANSWWMCTEGSSVAIVNANCQNYAFSYFGGATASAFRIWAAENVFVLGDLWIGRRRSNRLRSILNAVV